MKFCPLRSTAEKEVPCSNSCALYAENEQCALKNIGNMDIIELDSTIRTCTDSLNYELRNMR